MKCLSTSYDNELPKDLRKLPKNMISVFHGKHSSSGSTSVNLDNGSQRLYQKNNYITVFFLLSLAKLYGTDSKNNS